MSEKDPAPLSLVAVTSWWALPMHGVDAAALVGGAR